MHATTREQMHMRLFLSSLPGLGIFIVIARPALERWAIVTADPQPCQGGLEYKQKRPVRFPDRAF